MAKRQILRLVWVCASAAIVLFGARAARGADTLVATGSVWRYFDNGSDQGTAWSAAAFDDSAWASGPAQLGYGDGDEATVISYGAEATNKFITTYFRHAFVVADASTISNLSVRLMRDDGGIVYLNGVEVFRNNMPTGAVTYLSLAATNVLGADESAFFRTNVSASLLVNGTNTLAVEIHQAAVTSADLSFDLELLSLPPSAPTISITSPAGGATFQTPVNVTITTSSSDADGTVDLVEFFTNGVKLAESRTPSFTFTWNNVPAGAYTLTARATDNMGLITTSAPVNITVNSVGDLLVAAGSIWKYLDDGSNQSNAWPEVGFDDSVWNSGPAQLGYGDGDEATIVSYGTNLNNKYITTYFRRAFTVSDPALYAGLLVDLLRDDGAVVYLNGREVFRSNMPAGTIGYNTLASTSVGPPAESTFYRTTVSPTNLLAGTNVLAVEVHQNAANSSDLSFDLKVTGTFGTPVVQLTRGPYLQMGTWSNAIVRWRTDLPESAVVHFGTDASTLTNVATDSTVTNEHIVLITGLAAETKYFYSIGGTNSTYASGTNYFFVTAPLPGAIRPVRVWVVGDSGTGNNNARNVRDGYLSFAGSRQTDLWLMLGDNAYNSGQDSEYQSAVFDMYPTVLRNTFLWPAIGNHDSAFSSTATSFPYLDIFSLPPNGEAGGLPSGTEKYYSFDFANIHFICLDAMTSSRATNGAMLTWLRNDLAATTQQWNIAFWHHPPYTKGSHDSDTEIELIQMRQNALPILEAGGVDLVLCGHSHVYERSYLLDGHYNNSSTLTDAMKKDGGDGRDDGTGVYNKPEGITARQGAVYVVAGSSGQATGGPLNHPAMYLSANVLGSMVLDINSNRLDAKFLTTNATVLDHFTLLKGVPPESIPGAPTNSVATALSASQIRVTWGNASTNEAGFSVERSTDGTNFTAVGGASPNITRFVDSGLAAATTYYYRVVATNSVGASGYSMIASATTALPPPPLAPTNFVARAGDGANFFRSEILLTWQDRATNELGFQLERSTNGVTFAAVATIAADVTNYLDINLETATTYWYRLKSYNAGGDSPYVIASETTHPQSQVAVVGSTVVFHAGNDGEAPFTYQWRFNNVDILSATNEALTFVNVQPSNEGSYSVVVTNVDGTVTSNPAYLTVISPPEITAQPASQTNNIGTTATFTVTASGTSPLFYQWRFNGTNVLDATNDMLVLSNVQYSNGGNYSVMVSNAGGTVLSSNALLTVNSPPLAANDTIYRYATQGIRVAVTNILANDSDADGDLVTLVSVSSLSASNASVTRTGEWIYYTPPDGFTNADSFTYTIADNRGGSGDGTVFVLIKTDSAPSHNLRVALLGDGSVRITFDGIPGRTYRIQYTETLGDLDWQTLGSRTADSTGAFEYIDTPPPGTASRFYRSIYP